MKGIHTISIHVPLAGDDPVGVFAPFIEIISIHVPLAGDDRMLVI